MDCRVYSVDQIVNQVTRIVNHTDRKVDTQEQDLQIWSVALHMDRVYRNVDRGPKKSASTETWSLGQTQYASAGTTVTFSCNETLYALFGATSVTCEVGSNGFLQWSAPLPTCRRKYISAFFNKRGAVLLLRILLFQKIKSANVF